MDHALTTDVKAFTRDLGFLEPDGEVRSEIAAARADLDDLTRSNTA